MKALSEVILEALEYVEVAFVVGEERPRIGPLNIQIWHFSPTLIEHIILFGVFHRCAAFAVAADDVDKSITIIVMRSERRAPDSDVLVLCNLACAHMVCEDIADWTLVDCGAIGIFAGDDDEFVARNIQSPAEFQILV